VDGDGGRTPHGDEVYVRSHCVTLRVYRGILFPWYSKPFGKDASDGVRRGHRRRDGVGDAFRRYRVGDGEAARARLHGSVAVGLGIHAAG